MRTKKKGRPSRCPSCNSAKSRSRGFKYRANGKKSKDRQCIDCGRRYLLMAL